MLHFLFHVSYFMQKMFNVNILMVHFISSLLEDATSHEISITKQDFFNDMMEHKTANIVIDYKGFVISILAEYVINEYLGSIVVTNICSCTLKYYEYFTSIEIKSEEFYELEYHVYLMILNHESLHYPCKPIVNKNEMLYRFNNDL